MANVDTPRGFTPVGTINGSAWGGHVRAYQADPSATDIFIGDMVTMQANGLIDAADAAEVDLLGVAIGVLQTQDSNTTTGIMDQALGTGSLHLERLYYDASADGSQWVLVVVGPDVLYEVQADGITDLIDVGNNCEIVATAGSTLSGRSQQEASSTTVATTAQLRLVGPAQRVDNDVTTANSKWVVRINENHYTKLAGI